MLVEDWCQQYPSHSVGSLVFGPDGALYASGGDGASFNFADWGQRAAPRTRSFTPQEPVRRPTERCDDTADRRGRRAALAGPPHDCRRGGGTGYLDAVLGSSPSAYWRLGEASGTVADDRIGSADGTYINAPTLGVPGATGDGNTAVRLTAADSEYVNVPALTTLPSPLTIESWVNSNGLPVSDAGIAGWFQSDTFKSALYWAGTTEVRFSSTSTGDAPLIASGLSQLTSGWHHLVGTYDGANARLYLDGAIIAGPTPKTLVGGASSTSFKVGQYGAPWRTYSNASFDEVAVYNRALSAAEVAAHYAARNGSGSRRSRSASTARSCGSTRRPARACPATRSRRAPMRTPAGSSPTACATRSGSTFRPGTNELWVGDVGWNTWEEINRIPNATDAVAENFGWPCYEGARRQSGYDGANLSICENLYAAGAGAIAAPYYTYNHSRQGRRRRDLPDRAAPSITGHRVLPGGGRVVSRPSYRRRRVLRRPQPELHLVHAEGHQRPAGPEPASRRSSTAPPTRWTS